MLFPLLYLPNLGLGGATAFGTLEVSDFLLGPYIILTLLAVRPQTPKRYQRLLPWLLGFVCVALLSTLTIYFRYPMASSYSVHFGLLKLAKLSMYVAAGLLTARALSFEGHRSRYPWAILAGTAVIALSLLAMPDETGRWTRAGETSASYSSANAVSVMMAILSVYIIGRISVGSGSSSWRQAALWLSPLLILGFSLSHGRGGWVAAFAGLLYLFLRSGISKRNVVIATLGVVVIGVAYSQFPQFKYDVDRTLWPEKQYLDAYGAGVLGLDDGLRLLIAMTEIQKVTDAFWLGTGFFHRGPTSGISTTGSHNFWLQMLLETGAIGFALLAAVGLRIWKHARRAARSDDRLPVQAALVTALVGGLSGEYFYGGMALFTIFAIYAPLGGEQGSVQTNFSSRGALRLVNSPTGKIDYDRF